MGATSGPGERGSSDQELFETTSASSSPQEKRDKEKELQDVLCICLEILANSKGNNLILQA